jgi:hypothetical protein
LLGLWPLAVRWLSDPWVFDEAPPTRLTVEIPAQLERLAGAGLILLLAGSSVAWVLLGARRRDRAVMLDPEADPGPNPDTAATGIMLALVSIGVGLVVVVLADAGVLAAAARAVDVTTRSSAALEQVWVTWMRRGLFALAGVTLGIGVIERPLSARRLRRALRQTPAQARAEARRGGRR